MDFFEGGEDRSLGFYAVTEHYILRMLNKQYRYICLMYRKNLLIILAACSIFSCKKEGSDESNLPPVADFTYTFTGSHFAPAQVNFTNTSTNATSYYWTFGDTGVSTAISQSYIYNNAGDFTVTLKATSVDGEDTKSAVIHIGNATLAKITSIELWNFPTLDSSGNSWDTASGPDIYFRIYRNIIVEANYDTTVFDNSSATPITLDLSANPFEIPISKFDTMYHIAIFDKDNPTPPDPQMGIQVGFKISDIDYTHPAYFDKEFSNNKYRVYITWE
jgi:PKD repeat protein